MYVCTCSCVSWYLGMARRSEKGLLGLQKAPLGSKAHIRYFLSHKHRICISFSFSSQKYKKIRRRGTTCFEFPAHHVLHFQISHNMAGIIFIINKGWWYPTYWAVGIRRRADAAPCPRRADGLRAARRSERGPHTTFLPQQVFW